MSIGPGDCRARLMADSVISLNRTRKTLLAFCLRLSLPLISSAICQAIASPSRSGSGARNTLSTSSAFFLISANTLAFPLIVTYCGVKSRSTSTPSLLVGRSLTCPTEAITVYPRPRYLVMVLALAGDSTMIRDFAMPAPECVVARHQAGGDIYTGAILFFKCPLYPNDALAGQPPHRTVQLHPQQ